MVDEKIEKINIIFFGRTSCEKKIKFVVVYVCLNLDLSRLFVKKFFANIFLFSPHLNILMLEFEFLSCFFCSEKSENRGVHTLVGYIINGEEIFL
jgi:hypothetical protein